MRIVQGNILTENGFTKGYIGIQDNEIVEMAYGNAPKDTSYEGIITPSFVNMHTHIGDAFIRNRNIKLPKDLMKLVAPPDGIKHQLLQQASDEEQIQGMKQALQTMKTNGINTFVDFRENGKKGIQLITKALGDISLNSLILSRPSNMYFDTKELDTILQISQGIGLSSIEDWDYQEISNIASYTKKKGKLFSIHVSERIREDISKVVELQPDFIIHMTQGTKKDFQTIKNHQIPIVVCPRSNNFFGLKPPLSSMKEVGNTLLIGTDNAMLNQPNLVDEINQIRRDFPTLFTLEELLHMITYNPRKVLNSKDVIPRLNSPASYLVLDKSTLKPLFPIIACREGLYEN